MSPSDVAADRPFPPEPGSPGASPPKGLSKTRPFYWSVRREIWENPAIYLAPVAIAVVVMLGLVFGAINLPHKVVHLITTLDPAKQAEAVAFPYNFAAFAIIVTAFIVAVFYCLSALNGERRDRTILFWKSLPVSDLTTVLAKLSVPLVVLPLLTFAVVLVTLLIMFGVSAIMLPAIGLPTAQLWAAFPMPRTALDLLYVIAVLALWHAPIWGWLLLVSGWARRAAFLWAVGPPLAISVFERLAFGTDYIWSLLRYRLTGGLTEAFAAKTGAKGQIQIDLQHLDPLKLLVSPGLWTGLALAAVLVAAAVWQRRYRTPI